MYAQRNWANQTFDHALEALYQHFILINLQLMISLMLSNLILVITLIKPKMYASTKCFYCQKLPPTAPSLARYLFQEFLCHHCVLKASGKHYYNFTVKSCKIVFQWTLATNKSKNTFIFPENFFHKNSSCNSFKW